ncbi:Protein HOTHEAD [Linum grandiflorum]
MRDRMAELVACRSSCFPLHHFLAIFLFLFFFHGGRSSASQQDHNYTFVRDATAAPGTSYYDYIIVGGGTAGCPLAATLSQNATVLVLERGGSPYGDPNITYLANFGAPLADLSPSSPAQRFVSEDGVINSRARVLGGGSCLNAGFYTRAGADYISDVGWNAELAESSYEWVEKKVAFEPPVGKWQSAVRDGLVEAGIIPNNGFTYDHIYGTKCGGSIFDTTGRRHSAADLLHYANPNRLAVLLKATAHKIIFHTKGIVNCNTVLIYSLHVLSQFLIEQFLGKWTGRTRPRAHGVVFRDSAGVKHKAYLNRGAHNEIILSAGALGSPQLLMLSGVGPSDQLKAHNITVVLDNHMVGQSMLDNPMNAVFIPSPVPVEVSLVEVVGITHFGGYIEASSGTNFGNAAFNHGFLSPKIGQLSTLPPKQRTREALERTIYNMSKLDSATLRGGFIVEKIARPLSTGHLELTSKNPNANPSVTFNYFKHPEDLNKCVQGLSTIEKVINSKSFSKFRYGNLPISQLLNMTASAPLNMLPRHGNTSTSLEQYCKDTVMTIWHYHGGCQIGEVVGPDYKVLGVDDLRVIDGSTFNVSPGTNPQATLMMLGRYMGVTMLTERFANGEDHSK